MSNTISPYLQSIFAPPTNGAAKANNALSSGSATKVTSDPITEFLAYQKLSPQEKIVDSILKKHGLTKEDLAKLSPEDLKKIQDEIKAELQQQTKQQLAEKGILLDMSA